MSSLFKLAAAAVALAGTFAVHAQTLPAGAPAGSTVLCKDGSYGSTKVKAGACRGHKGIETWYGTPEAEKPVAAKAPTGATAVTSQTGVSTSKVAPTPATSPAAAKAATPIEKMSEERAANKSMAATAATGAAATTATAAAAARPEPSSVPATPMDKMRKNSGVPTTPATAAAVANDKKRPDPATMTAAPGGGAGKVWVNADSKVYHCMSDRYYGKTKSGEYMSEADAKAKGMHAARNKACS